MPTACFGSTRRGATPQVLALVEAPGGLAFDGDGSLIVGFGNSVANGSVGDATGPSGLLRIDPDTGAQSVFATGLSMANGLDRGPDGSFYASNDFGSNIDRVRNGVTERGWARVESGNGLVVDSAGRYLYVAQTFRPAAIQRVDLSDPSLVTEYVRADPADMAAGLDGMTRDARDRLIVTANGSGEVWRVDTEPSICVLLDGLPAFPDGPSAVATGSRQGSFPAENAYVVTFAGDLIELVDVAAVEPVGEALRRLRHPGSPAPRRRGPQDALLLPRDRVAGQARGRRSRGPRCGSREGGRGRATGGARASPAASPARAAGAPWHRRRASRTAPRGCASPPASG